MKKTKLLTSLAAFVLVLGLGACNQPDEETTSEEGGEVTTTDTGSSSEGETPSEPVAYAIVGDFVDNSWNESPATDSVYYIPAGTEHYEATVEVPTADTLGYEPSFRVVEYGTWNLVADYDNLDVDNSTGVTGSHGGDNNIELIGGTYDLVFDFGETNTILVTLQTEEGGNDGEGTTYKLGAADPSTGVYYYFSGSTRSTTDTNLFLATTTSWDDAAAVTITDLTDGGQSLSFVDGNGATKYIAWDGENGNTSIQLYDEAYTWYWVESINGYCTASDGNASARYLALYASGPDFRAYNPSDTYLAYGHVAAYTEEPETITPEPEPEGEFPFEVGTDYFLGYDRSGTIYYYNGEVLNTYYGDVTTDISKAVKVKLGESGEGYTLQLENGKYLGADLGDHNNFKWDLTDPYEWEYNSTYQTFVAYNSSNTAYCLGTTGTYNEITVFTLSSAASNYPATLYEIPKDWTPYEEPDINEESFETVTTGKLGLYQENKAAYYYFTGSKDGNFGAMSTNWEQGVEVTLLTDSTYYYIRFVSNGSTLYFGHTNSSNSQVALNADPYPLQYDTTNGAYLNTDGSRFLGTYSSYETLSWSEVSFIGNSGQFKATIYETNPGEIGGDEEQGGNEGNEDETLVGTLDFSVWCTENANANTAFSTTTLENCLTASYTGEGTITAGNTSKAYPASNGSGDGLKGSKECIQLGASSSTGNISFSLSGTDEITRIVVKAVCYENSAKNMTVNGNSKSVSYICTSYSAWDDVPTIEYTIDAATTITIASVTASSGRILLHSVELYSA